MLPAVCIHIFLYSLHCLQYSELLQVLQHFNWDGDQAKGQAQGIVLLTAKAAGGTHQVSGVSLIITKTKNAFYCYMCRYSVVFA